MSQQPKIRIELGHQDPRGLIGPIDWIANKIMTEILVANNFEDCSQDNGEPTTTTAAVFRSHAQDQKKMETVLRKTETTQT